MKTIKIFSLVLCATVFFTIFCSCHDAFGEISLYDGKLVLSGFLKNTTYYRLQMDRRETQYHDSRVDFSKNAALLEALYTYREGPDSSLKFFGSVRYWYEMMCQLDSQMRKAISPSLRKNYRNPRSFDDDVLTELYADFIKGPWNIRLGKQIVTWGELDVNRAADVVNPIDLRWGVPGVEAWEEIKRGLWLIRTTYQSELPGNLFFENIINPGHFLSAMPAPPCGAHWSNSAGYNNPFTKWGPGFFDWQLTRWMHEAREQRYDIKNWELGFRVRGYAYNIDWTLLWYNAPADAPVVNATHAKAFTNQYVGVALPASILGKRSFSWNDLPDVTSYPHDVYYWKRMQTFGGTAQTTFNNFMPSAVWKCEVAFNKGEPFNLSTDQSKTNIYDWTRKNTLAFAFSWSDRWNIPWFTRTICTGKQLETSLTYYRQNILNRNGRLVTQDYYIDRGDAANEQINLFVQAYMFNYSWVFTFVGSYQTYSDRYQAVPIITYTFPGEHWRVDFGAKWYNAKRGYVRSSYWAHDSLLFRLRYEF